MGAGTMGGGAVDHLRSRVPAGRRSGTLATRGEDPPDRLRGRDDHEPASEDRAELNDPLVIMPMFLTPAMQTTTRAARTAYSTDVGPSSLTRKHRVRVKILSNSGSFPRTVAARVATRQTRFSNRPGCPGMTHQDTGSCSSAPAAITSTSPTSNSTGRRFTRDMAICDSMDELHYRITVHRKKTSRIACPLAG
jgi:hypothetical protein